MRWRWRWRRRERARCHRKISLKMYGIIIILIWIYTSTSWRYISFSITFSRISLGGPASELAHRQQQQVFFNHFIIVIIFYRLKHITSMCLLLAFNFLGRQLNIYISLYIIYCTYKFIHFRISRMQSTTTAAAALQCNQTQFSTQHTIVLSVRLWFDRHDVRATARERQRKRDVMSI